MDLDGDNYQTHEIEALLQLRAPYSYGDVQAAKAMLTQQLASNDGQLSPEKRREVLFFLDGITQRLSNTMTALTTTTGLPGFAATVLQQGGSFIIEPPDRRIGKDAKAENGRITDGASNAPPGYMNPINVRTIMQAICIDSRFRPNYYATKSTNFSVILPSIQKNVLSMRVSSMELPITYYAVSRSNDNATMLLMVNDVSGDGWVLNLPDGNYEQSWAGNSHAAHIETAMNQAITLAVPVTVDTDGNVTSRSGAALSTTTDLNFALDHASGRAIFGIPPGAMGGVFAMSGFIARFNVNQDGTLTPETNIQLRLGWQLGFRAGQYTAMTSCVSEGICLVAGPRYAFIAIDDHQMNTGSSYIVAYANSVLQHNIITRINLAELQADVGVYQSSSDPGLSNQLNRTREYFGPVDIQRLHIAIYDEYGRVIDLNNMDWSITLAFELLYN
jgi:hypothetical protein